MPATAGSSPQRRCKCFSLGIRSNHISGKRGGWLTACFWPRGVAAGGRAAHAHLQSHKQPQECFVLLFLSLFCWVDNGFIGLYINPSFSYRLWLLGLNSTGTTTGTFVVVKCCCWSSEICSVLTLFIVCAVLPHSRGVQVQATAMVPRLHRNVQQWKCDKLIRI